jgi:predicted transcriptional regulator
MDTRNEFVGTISEISEYLGVTRDDVVQSIREEIILECFFDKNGLVNIVNESF